MDKLQQAIQLFDAYNQQDPNTLIWDEVTYPSEYFYALKLFDWVLKLDPDASETILLASRCQHIGRWTIPRDTYPDGKAGYLTWRSDLAKFHAVTSAYMMLQVGYDDTTIEEVRRITLKQKIKLDAEVQLMENALCLVFLQFQFEDFIQKHDDEKLVHIVKKTWNKMSQPGRDAAFTLKYTPKALKIIKLAIT